MSIGSRIRDARNAKGLTQEQLASFVNVTKGAISNYEADQSSPRIDILYSLMSVLGVDANYIFQDNMHHVTSYSLLPDEVHLVDVYRTADPRSRSDAVLLLTSHQVIKDNEDMSIMEIADRMVEKAKAQNGMNGALKEAK